MAGAHQRNVAAMQRAPRCGARTRAGGSCQAPSIAGAARCRKHGGKGSGAPLGNRNALKKGLHTAAMRAQAREVRHFLARAKVLMAINHAGVSAEDDARGRCRSPDNFPHGPDRC
jgi:hypothetical protein